MDELLRNKRTWVFGPGELMNVGVTTRLHGGHKNGHKFCYTYKNIFMYINDCVKETKWKLCKNVIIDQKE